MRRPLRWRSQAEKLLLFGSLFTLAFAQLSARQSLRDIEACLKAMQLRLYHMGFRGKVSRNNLTHANEHRDWRIYADLTQR